MNADESFFLALLMKLSAFIRVASAPLSTGHLRFLFLLDLHHAQFRHSEFVIPSAALAAGASAGCHACDGCFVAGMGISPGGRRRVTTWLACRPNWPAAKPAPAPGEKTSNVAFLFTFLFKPATAPGEKTSDVPLFPFFSRDENRQWLRELFGQGERVRKIASPPQT